MNTNRITINKIQEMKVHLSYKSPFLLGISAPLGWRMQMNLPEKQPLFWNRERVPVSGFSQRMSLLLVLSNMPEREVSVFSRFLRTTPKNSWSGLENLRKIQNSLSIPKTFSTRRFKNSRLPMLNSAWSCWPKILLNPIIKIYITSHMQSNQMMKRFLIG